MKKHLIKIISLLLIIGLNWSGISAIGYTLAYFNDTETSNTNTCQVGILDFSLNSAADFSPDNLTPCISVSRDISVINHGNPIQYTVESAEFSGDTDFCDILQLTAELDGTEKYNGNLIDFNYGPVEFSEPENWNFVVSLNSSDLSLQNKSCQFKFVFDGWQTNLSDSSIGFSDQEEIVNNVATGDWTPEVEVIYPNGGEIWYLVPPAYAHDGFGRYELQWEATSPVYNDMDLSIDIWYCDESGANCFFEIVHDTENDGSYWWTLPYESRFIGSDEKIKVIATDVCGFTEEDKSDADFCPPMLTEAEVLQMLALMAIEPLEEESIVEEAPIIEESSAIDTTSTDEEIAEETIEEPVSEPEIPIEAEVTETEENQEERGIIEEINEIIDGVIDEIVDELLPDETTTDELLPDETTDELIEEEPVIIEEPAEEETLIIEETPTINEFPVEEAPAVEEQSIVEETPIIEEVTVEPVIEPVVQEEAPVVEEQPIVIPDE